MAPSGRPDIEAEAILPLLDGRSARVLHQYRSMTISITGLVVLLIVAGICGGIGRAIGGGTGGGFFVSIAVGFVGALLGTFVAHYFHLPELLMVTRRPPSVPDPVVDHRRFAVRGVGASCLGRGGRPQLALPLRAAPAQRFSRVSAQMRQGLSLAPACQLSCRPSQ